ncbi:MAG: hypothetical protein ACUVYA_05630 [Planctomycetota bacterium]
MFFGKSSYREPERGVPASLRNQLLLLVAALAVVVLAVRIVPALRRDARRGERGDELGPQSVLGFGKRIEEKTEGVAPELSLAPPIAPQAPEPYREDPEILRAGAAADRTSKFDERLIAHLLQKVRTAGESLDRETPALRLERDPSDVWRKLIDSPDAYRGRLIELKGEILSPGGGSPIFALRGIEFPNPSGLDRAYQSFILGTDQKYYMLATVESDPELRHRDYVRIRAYFAQLYTYFVDYRGRLQLATIPFLVGRRYDVLERPRVAADGGTGALPIVAALGVIAVVAVLVLDLPRLGRRRRPPAVLPGRGLGAGPEGGAREP